MIREEKTYQLPSIIQTGQRHGMITLEQSVRSLVQRRLVEKSVAEDVLASIRVDSEDGPERAQIKSTRRSMPTARPQTPTRPEPRAAAPGRSAAPATGGSSGDPRESSANLSRARIKVPRAKKNKGDVVFVLGTDGRVKMPEPQQPLPPGSRGAKPPIRVSGLRRSPTTLDGEAPPAEAGPAAVGQAGAGPVAGQLRFPLPPAPPGQGGPPPPGSASRPARG